MELRVMSGAILSTHPPHVGSILAAFCVRLITDAFDGK